MRATSVVLAVLLLAGCKLIDQTTFAPSPEAKAQTTPAPAAPKVDSRTPLVAINFADPDPDYQGLLRYALHAAETRDPSVDYDVIALLPPNVDAAAQQRHGLEVMRAMVAQGVSANRIHLGLRSTPAGGEPEVRIYVR
jgi:type IV pilus biogenesis protein CpaD/CtpE